MAAIYRLGEARVADVRKEIADAPSYSALRALIRILEDKGCLAHRQVGASYVYRATLPKRQASRRALRNLVGTFFGNSVEDAVVALIDDDASALTEEQLARLEARIRAARSKGDSDA